MINQWRKKIDEIDERIMKLLSERLEFAKKIATEKKKEGSPLYRPDREHKIYEKLKKINKTGLPDRVVENIYREIMSTAIYLEGSLKIGYLGPAGSFTHQAVIKRFGHSLETVPFRDFEEIFDGVQKHKIKYGVLPIENSSEGIVNATLDALLNYPINIYAEIHMPISHNLITKSNSLNQIKEIYTHKQAYAQTKGWITSNLPKAEFKEMPSTSSGVEYISKCDRKNIAAIGSRIASEIYQVDVLAHDIEDYKRNFTRFIVIGHDHAEKTGNDRTSIVFTLPHQPGALYSILRSIFESGLNLTSIESRPAKSEPWTYIFYIDLEGHYKDKNVSDAIENLKSKTPSFRLLGSYPIDNMDKENHF